MLTFTTASTKGVMFILNIRNYNRINLYEMEVNKEFILKLKKFKDLGENEKPLFYLILCLKLCFIILKELNILQNYYLTI